MRHRPNVLEIVALAAVVAMLLIVMTHPAKCETHPFIRFQSGFYRLLDKYAWEDWPQERRLKLCRAIWNGCGRNYTEASYAACIGVMESHYTRKEPHRDYTKTCGYLGAHCRTALAEVRRLHLPGSKRYWINELRRNPIQASGITASRWAYISGVYRCHEVALRQWCTGEGWKHTKKDAVRSMRYVRDVERLRERYF